MITTDTLIDGIYAWKSLCVERDAQIERQQKAIDLLLKAIEPFAVMSEVLPEDGLIARVRASDEVDFRITGADLRAARSAKEQVEKILKEGK